MNTSIIVLVHNRPRLTRQTLDSIVRNTSVPYNVLVCDDSSDAETQAVLAEFVRPNIRVVRYETPVGIIGALRNAGAASAEWTFGTPEYVAFLDNDICVTAFWLDSMIEAEQRSRLSVLGGYRHPFHGVNAERDGIEETDAVAGYSMLMRWQTWERYRPFAANQQGVGASEDFVLCQRIIKDGGKVGYVHPPVLYHCGVTNSNGQPAVGAEHFRRAEGILFE